MNEFFITGMFRSGTTLVSRMLNAHSQVICASDPFAPIFKSFRNTIEGRKGAGIEIEGPLEDHYWEASSNNRYRLSRDSDFEVAISLEEIEMLRGRIWNHCGEYSPAIRPYLHELCGKTYSEVFKSAYQIVEKSYFKENASAVGFKEVWTDEYAHHMRKDQPKRKVIHIVRDIRGVIGSNFASGRRYPLIFMCRQWRKLASLGWISAQKEANVKVIRYEDLVSSTETTAKEICRHLEVDYDESVVDSNKFADGSGRAWVQNTSYKRGESNRQGFDMNNLERWREVLGEEEERVIDLLCGAEMELLGYSSRSFDRGEHERLLSYEEETDQFADWIRPYTDVRWEIEIEKEIDRSKILGSEDNVSSLEIQDLALETDIFEALRRIKRRI